MSTLAYSVVLPAYNEEDLLQLSVDEITKGLRDRSESFEIIVVENGSTDRTAAVAEVLSRVPEVRMLRLPTPDYGRATRAGLLAATGELVVHFDVDYYDLAFLYQAAALINTDRAGIVLASKRAPGAHDRRPLMRRVLTAGFTLAMRTLLSVPVSDSHGMKVLSRERCEPLARACVMTGPLFDVELVVRASDAGVPIAELPADVTELRPPRTSVLGRAVASAAGLLRLRFVLWKERRAAHK